MNSRTRQLITLLVVGAALAAPAARAGAQAGLQSGQLSVPLSATRPGALTVSIQGGSVQTIANLTDGAANDFSVGAPVTIYTQWNLKANSPNIKLMAYFASATQALANGSSFIPSSRVLAKLGTAGTFVPFTGNAVGGVGTAGATVQLFSQAIGGANKASNRTDNVYLRIDLTTAPATVPGDYVGTLTLRAVTN